VANPLTAETNTVAVLFDAMPKGTVYKFDSASGGYVSAIKNFGSWNNKTMTLLPGEGAFVKNPQTTNITITFVGEVSQGSLTNPLPAGYALVGSQVPQEDTVDALGYPVANNDTIYRWDPAAQGYLSSIYKFGKWSAPGAPTIKVAEAFFSKKAVAANWIRSFSVNQ